MGFGRKIPLWTRVYIGSSALHGDTRSVSELENSLDPADMTAWPDRVFHASLGRRMAGIKGYRALINDATGRSLPTLTDATTVQPASFLFGTNGEPVAGNAVYVLPSAQMGPKFYFDNYAGLLGTEFTPSATYPYIGNPIGFVLIPETAISGAVTGSTVDTGSAAANGWHAALHVVSNGGTHTFTVEHSSDGSSWSTLGTFTINGSAKVGEAIGGTGSVNQKVRFKATGTGSCTIVCCFSRWNYAALS